MKYFKNAVLGISFLLIITCWTSMHAEEITVAEEETITSEPKDIEPVQSPSPANMLTSTFGIYFFGGIGFPFGDLLDTEHDLSYVTVQYSNGETKTGRPEHDFYFYGFNLDGYLYNSRNLTVGIRGRFTKGIIDQTTKVGGGEYKSYDWNETLIDFNSLGIGGIIIWSPFPHKNVGLTGFITTGKLIGSKINPMPILNSENHSQYPLPKDSYDINGYLIEVGTGGQYAFSIFTLGLEVVYSQFYFDIDNDPYSPLLSGKTNVYAFSIEVFAGVHF